MESNAWISNAEELELGLWTMAAIEGGDRRQPLELPRALKLKRALETTNSEVLICQKVFFFSHVVRRSNLRFSSSL